MDDFAYVYQGSCLGEFYAQTDVNEATMVLTHKIMTTLNIVSPVSAFTKESRSKSKVALNQKRSLKRQESSL